MGQQYSNEFEIRPSTRYLRDQSPTASVQIFRLKFAIRNCIKSEIEKKNERQISGHSDYRLQINSWKWELTRPRRVEVGLSAMGILQTNRTWHINGGKRKSSWRDGKVFQMLKCFLTR